MGDPAIDDEVCESCGCEIKDAPLDGSRCVPVCSISLIELLMLGTLLGLLAATTIPQLLHARETAQQKSLHETLAAVRCQIEHFQEHHQGRLPAQGTDSEDEFVAQLCGRTMISGHVETNARFGPYLLGEFPPNPCSGNSGVLVVAGPLQTAQLQTDRNLGWAYSSTTGDFRAILGASTVD
ncbi:hypothetical protein GC176_10775 [bacterium]|nr:hypothetical protein [bacterium]